jgi:hypothetical protein
MSLLKVRERETQREHGGHRWSVPTERESAFLFQVLLKSALTHGQSRADMGDFHPITSE